MKLKRFRRIVLERATRRRRKQPAPTWKTMHPSKAGGIVANVVRHYDAQRKQD